MKKVLIISLIVLTSGIAMGQQKKKDLPKNLTGTLSFKPDAALGIQTKNDKIHVLVPDEDVDAIFTTTNDELFEEIYTIISRLTDTDSVVQIRGTKLGALAKIYPNQFKKRDRYNKKRGLKLNDETTVYALSGYKIIPIVYSGNTANPVGTSQGNTNGDGQKKGLGDIIN